jgi:TRAP-type uncharacterized transport system fused permease subunit
VLKKLDIRGKINGTDLVEAFETGAKYALAVGAAAGTVGIVIGVVTLTGVGFKLSYVVTSAAHDASPRRLAPCCPRRGSSSRRSTLIAALSMTGARLHPARLRRADDCDVHHHGDRRRADAGAMGVQPLVAHFFVFYYGVLADITPPVAMARTRPAGMAGSDPFKTGNTRVPARARKALVPFVFVFLARDADRRSGLHAYDSWFNRRPDAFGIALLAAALSKSCWSRCGHGNAALASSPRS